MLYAIENEILFDKLVIEDLNSFAPDKIIELFELEFVSEVATALGVTKAYSEGKLILATLIGIQGAMQVATINAQKYATGGLVGGRRHSQGGTMIEAEQGEYVVSRAGV